MEKRMEPPKMKDPLMESFYEMKDERDYWQTRCELAEKFMNATQATGFLNNSQLIAQAEWQEFIKRNDKPNE